MGVLELLLTVLAVAIAFAVPFAFFAYVRYLRYKETIALAERGLVRPESRRPNRNMLRWGIVIMMLGLGLACGLWPLGFLAMSEGPRSNVSEGVSADGDTMSEGARSSNTEGVSADGVASGRAPLGIGPWMLLGILPFFFGLSLILIHWVGRREGIAEGDAEAIPPHKRVEPGGERET